ncbi:MAG TPA: DUF4136 domain-containing protein [Spongiibacteraceae bacterium]|jgi:hypothetical protein|nr:DUF4136 domain-containing protein [Spongiibacteraceae bacterium]HUH38502.1 DUF4136 domain-containing protein [Spongiibacteraceae bacterium]
MIGRTLKALLLVSLGWLLLACASAPKVSLDYSPEFRFDAIKSYSIVPPTGAALAQAGLATQRIENAVREQMALLGVAETTPDKADIIVSYGVVTEEKTRVTTYPEPMPYRCYRCGYGGAWGGATAVDVHEYTQGTLVIDMINPQTKQVVWRGVGTANISGKKTPEERSAMINAYVAEMFKSLGKRD